MATNNSINAPLPISATQGGTGATSLNLAKANLNTSSFVAYPSVDITNVTGTGTGYIVVFNTVLSNVGSNYNIATGVYTAPVTGDYLFTASIYINGLTALMTNGEMWFNNNSSLFKYEIYKGNSTAMAVGGTDLACSAACIAHMSAGDTMSVEIVISGGVSDTVDVTSDSRFGGYFIG